MAFRITSIKRIDPATLQDGIAAGFARWRFIVEYWPGIADGDALVSDEFVIESPTQLMQPTGDGDDWVLIPKEQTLRDRMIALARAKHSLYTSLIANGKRGYLGGSADVHGGLLGSDAISESETVQAAIGVVHDNS